MSTNSTLILEVDNQLLVAGNPEFAAKLAGSGKLEGTLLANGVYRTSCDAKPLLEALAKVNPDLRIRFATYQFGYTSRGDYTVRAHQATLIDLYLRYTHAYNLADLGCGKTSSTLWAFDILKSRGAVDVMLVTAPLSTVQPAWLQDAKHCVPHLKTVALLGSTKKVRLKKLLDGADIFVINHDGVKVLHEALLDLCRHKKVMLVGDEAVAYAKHNSERSEKTQHLAKGCKRVYLLTATPVAQSLLHAYGLIKLLGTRTSGSCRTFTTFRNEHFVKVSQFKYVPRSGALEAIQSLMSPAIYMPTRSVHTLPPCVYLHRQPPMTDDQRAAYTEMVNELRYVHGDGNEVNAANAAVKLMKLVQISCGILLGGENGTITIPPKHKMDDLYAVIEQSESKVIVFAPFTAVVDYIAAELRQTYGDDTVDILDGRVAGDKRGDLVARFQDPADPVRFLVAHPQPAGHGITLTEADTVVWFAPYNRTEVFIQANARHNRPGQTRSTRVVMLASTSEESRMYETAVEGRDQNAAFVDIFNALLKGESKTY